MSSPARGMPLCLQYIYTNLACGRFATALLTHPAAERARVVDLWTRDPRRLDPGEDEAFIHTALLLPNGHLLDAEGVRTFGELCADFGMQAPLSDIRKAACPEPDTTSSEGTLIRRLADALGWRTGAPRATEVETATDNWKRAAGEFEAHGGMSSKPERVLAACIEEAEEALPGLTRLVKAVDQMEWSATRIPGLPRGAQGCDHDLRAGRQVLAHVGRHRQAALWTWSASLPVVPPDGILQASGEPTDDPYDAMEDAEEWVRSAIRDLAARYRPTEEPTEDSSPTP